MDHLKIGHFICTDHSELISKKYFKYFVDIGRKQPNAIVIFLDYKLYKLKQFGFQCYKINKTFLDSIRTLDIEEDETNFFKKFSSSKNLLVDLTMNIRDQPHSILSNLTNKENVEESKINFEYNNENGYLYKKL